MPVTIEVHKRKGCVCGNSMCTYIFIIGKDPIVQLSHFLEGDYVWNEVEVMCVAKNEQHLFQQHPLRSL